MSENGENASSTTEQSQEQMNVPQGSMRLEQKTIDTCTKVVDSYRARKIPKGQAAIQLYEAFLAEIEVNSLIDSYGSYLMMLDNFDKFRGAASQRGDQITKPVGIFHDANPLEEDDRPDPRDGGEPEVKFPQTVFVKQAK